MSAQVIYTEEEMARRYNISPRTAQRWRVTGQGPKWVRIGPRKVGYLAEACAEFDQRNTFQSRADEIAKQLAA